MTRPRRPILAAVCAALLLAVVGLWVDSRFWYRNVLVAAVGRHEYSAYADWANGQAAFLLDYYERPQPGARPFRFGSEPVSGLPNAGKAPNVLGWGERSRGAYFFRVRGPIWALLPIPALGVWWWWRGRKATAGFPVEPAKGDA